MPLSGFQRDFSRSHAQIPAVSAHLLIAGPAFDASRFNEGEPAPGPARAWERFVASRDRSALAPGSHVKTLHLLA
jgi:hypothetical protein